MVKFLLTEEWVIELLALPTQAEQLAQLNTATLLHSTGLAHLLDHAEQLVQRNPGRAHRLIVLCEYAAEYLAAAALMPRAHYLRAQCHAINGELAEALTLIESAYVRFQQLGMEAEAMRTFVGRMRVLGEQGDFRAALNAGEKLVNWLATVEASDTPLPAREAAMLRALVKNQQGICYDQLGQFQDALRAFETAEAIYAELAMPRESAGVKNNRGLALVYLGNVSEALTAFMAALAIQRVEELILPQAHTQSNLGEAYLLMGNYQAALVAYQEARRLLATQAALTDEQVNLRQMADAYLALNLYDEALMTYREAAYHFDRAAMKHERAWALWGIGATLARQQQPSAAAAALGEAAALFRTVDNMPLFAGVRLEQAALLAAQGDQATAFVFAEEALADVMMDEWPIQQFFAHLRLVDLHLATVQVDAKSSATNGNEHVIKAAEHLHAAQQLADRLALPHLRYRLSQRFAQLRLLQGSINDAITIFEQAVTEVESLRNRLSMETMRISFLHDKLSVYETLVQLYLDRGAEADIRRAFEMAEQARSRTLLERMAGLIEHQYSDVDDPQLKERLETLQADLNAIYSRLLNQEGSDEVGGVAERSLYNATLQARAVVLEQEISRLRLMIAPHTAVSSIMDVLPLPFSLQTIQEQLAADTVLVAYYLLADEIIAFVVICNQLHVMRQLGSRAVIEQALQRLYAQWQRFRVGAPFVTRHMVMLQQSTQRILQSLYDDLFAPIDQLMGALLPKAHLSGESPLRLTIVPHGFLHQAPFQAFYDGQQSLIERYLIAYTPSATTLAVVDPQSDCLPMDALVMGVVDSDIPAIQTEVDLVAAILPSAQIYMNEQATAQILMAQAPTSALIHLACHGIFRADNPMFSALKLGSGWLTAVEISQLRLHAALVVLSACESGRGHTSNGDEILGLARAFLGAGASTLVVSQWMVQDEAAAMLMADFYTHLASGLQPDAALRLAQLSVKQSYAHPYYWAPFVIMGNRGWQ
ncbi:MAG: CHAT domain-containing tetratricopeptide repeat protein [Caldilineaceae bacterium]